MKMSDFQRRSLTEKTYRQGITEISAKDPDLGGIVLTWGKPPFWTHAPGFPGIVMGILAQQVSLESARAAFAKLETTMGTIDPDGFLSLPQDALKPMGFSRQKASYVRGIADEILNGGFDFGDLKAMDNDAARNALMAFKGVGPWTADTYLLFSMRRPDVWPSGDLALETAIQELRGLGAKPSSEEADAMALSWKPWRAVAARILWHDYLCRRGRSVSV